MSFGEFIKSFFIFFLVILEEALLITFIGTVLLAGANYTHVLDDLSSQTNFLLLIFVAVIPGIYFIHFSYTKENRKKYIIFSGIIGLLIGGALFSISTSGTSLPGTNPHGNDGRRMGDLRQIQYGLELYADQNNNLYPPLADTCTDIGALKNYVEVTSLRHDPRVSRGYPDYQIAISKDKMTYLLRVVLQGERLDNYHSIGDIVSGRVMGCDCDAPSFCIRY